MGESSCPVLANVLEYDIEVTSSNSNRAIRFTFIEYP